MAYKKYYRRKNYKKNKRKGYSYIDRMEHYQKKANNGKSAREQDYAYGYISGMRGVVDNRIGTEAEKKGNNAGLRFWEKLTKVKI